MAEDRSTYDPHTGQKTGSIAFGGKTAPAPSVMSVKGMVHLYPREGESEKSLADRIEQYEVAVQEIIDDINIRWDAEHELRDEVVALLEANGLGDAQYIYGSGHDSLMKHANGQEPRDRAVAKREMIFALFDANGIDPKAKTTYDLGYNVVVDKIENEMWDRAEKLHDERSK